MSTHEKQNSNDNPISTKESPAKDSYANRAKKNLPTKQYAELPIQHFLPTEEKFQTLIARNRDESIPLEEKINLLIQDLRILDKETNKRSN